MSDREFQKLSLTRLLCNSLSLPEGVDLWSFEVEGGAVLARSDVKGLFLLNPTAWQIWLRFCEHISPEDTAVYLAAAYGISYEVAHRDVIAALAEWQKTLLAASAPTSDAFDFGFRPQDVGIYGSFICRLQGTSFHILLSSRDLIDEIVPRLQSLLVPAAGSSEITFRIVQADTCVYIFRDDELISVQNDPAHARVILLQEIVRSSASKSEFLAILHAGACGSEAKCVIFPAASHFGKTTLAVALRGAGLTLYADDSVALNRDRLNVPVMPFALMVREGSWPVISARFPEFDKLPILDRYGENVRFLQPNGETGIPAAQPNAIVFSQWDAGATTRVECLTTFDALVRLKDSGFWLAHDRDSIQNFLVWLQRLPAFGMVYSDVDEAVSSVKSLLNN